MPKDPQDPMKGLEAKSTTKSFMDMCNWGLAISAGSLALFTGNFDKFSTKHIEETTNSSFVLISVMSNKWLFFSGIILIFISALIFGSVRSVIYYKQFISKRTKNNYQVLIEAYLDAQKEARDASDDTNKKIERVTALKKANKAFDNAITYMEGNVSLITGAYPWMYNDNYLQILKAGAVIYLIGLILVGFYILIFIYYLPT